MNRIKWHLPKGSKEGNSMKNLDKEMFGDLEVKLLK